MEQNIVEWVVNSSTNNIWDVVDPIAKETSDDPQEISDLMNLALSCTDSIPDHRPSMSEILFVIQNLKSRRNQQYASCVEADTSNQNPDQCDENTYYETTEFSTSEWPTTVDGKFTLTNTLYGGNRHDIYANAKEDDKIMKSSSDCPLEGNTIYYQQVGSEHQISVYALPGYASMCNALPEITPGAWDAQTTTTKSNDDHAGYFYEAIPSITYSPSVLEALNLQINLADGPVGYFDNAAPSTASEPSYDSSQFEMYKWT